MPTFLSYSPNLEDVLLRRCFRNIDDGFYIDIGAHHPTFASVTRSFYDLGWSGINVEPGNEFALLKAERPRDINLEFAVADFEGETEFFIHDGCTATSSLSNEVAPLVEERAGTIVPKMVAVTTLKSIIDRHAPDRHIHFLKIDAEGAEDAIVRGADWSRHRPEVVVIESTEPFTNTRRDEEWQSRLRDANYTFAYFDGVNDFWVRNESAHLLEHFKLPINVLDDYRLWDQETAYWRYTCEKQSEELAQAKTKIELLSRQLVTNAEPASGDTAHERKPKVLYFTTVFLGGEESGGMLVCREHVRLLAGLENIDLTVFTIGSPVQREFVSSLGVRHVNIECLPPKDLEPDSWSLSPRKRWPFLWELDALSGVHIEASLNRLIDDLRPEVVITDYVLSAVWAPSLYQRALRRITITLNREADFYGQCRHLGRLGNNVSKSPIAEWRLRRFENWIYNNSDAVVALSRGDLPKNAPPQVESVVIEPMLEPREARWRYGATKRLFFVGNLAHFPNYEAIQWLATQFAPELAKRDPEARIAIVGASKNDVPAEWLGSNIDFRGVANKDEVRDGFVTSDLFIAPIANDFGSKIKVLECIAYGAPLMANKEALSGVPFSELVPQFRLDDPQGAVTLALELMSDESRLGEIGQKLAKEMVAARKRSSGAWSDLLERVRMRPVRQIPFGAFRRRMLGAASHAGSWLKWFTKEEEEEIEIATAAAYGVEVSGTYPVERLNGALLRWTNGSASIFAIPRKSPSHLDVALWGIAPNEGTDVCISANGVELYRGRIENHDLKTRLKLPAIDPADGLQLNIESSVFQPEGDPRRLGVAIQSVRLIS